MHNLFLKYMLMLVAGKYLVALYILFPKCTQPKCLQQHRLIIFYSAWNVVVVLINSYKYTCFIM